MTYQIITLGCKVNTYESNVMNEQLQKAGFHWQEKNPTDIVIINTCMVTDVAFHKSLKAIRKAYRENEKAIIIVVGCVSQVYLEAIQDMNIASIVLGNYHKSEIVTYIHKYIQNKKTIFLIENLKEMPFEKMQLHTFNQTRAFIKIQDGCNQYCSYCIIPYTRGPLKSKPEQDVLDETEQLVKQGYEEIVLTGIHTGRYGYPNDKNAFAHLLEKLVAIPQLKRLRISSIEINEITESVLNVFKQSSILVDHLHIPLQSGSDTVLRRMNRPYQVAELDKQIQEIRKIRPHISITTDVIVGFPGETDQEFNETLATINRIQFSKLHVFPYSKRQNTKAATMDNQVPDLIKKQRARILLDLSERLEQEYAQKFVGAVLEWLPETWKDGYLWGHTGNYLKVKVLGSKELLHHTIWVKLTKIHHHYVEGQLEKSSITV